ncbi:hypothetical protein E4414_04930 [Leptospira interrogans]|uniref:Uncharacterized protein n=1 Tax=Leptospira interrogans serovar Bataviae TaxID=312175 RepID=A0AAQ0B200_LEPIR|nr:hypothetical protein E4414_04930 [Leptospira interrogans]QOI50061.1 hypothetical protein Lepto1489_06070 [Leptospira interrogans serovar Bataviae]
MNTTDSIVINFYFINCRNFDKLRRLETVLSFLEFDFCNSSKIVLDNLCNFSNLGQRELSKF